MMNNRWVDKYFMSTYESDRNNVSETIRANIKFLWPKLNDEDRARTMKEQETMQMLEMELLSFL